MRDKCPVAHEAGRGFRLALHIPQGSRSGEKRVGTKGTAKPRYIQASVINLTPITVQSKAGVSEVGEKTDQMK